MLGTTREVDSQRDERPQSRPFQWWSWFAAYPSPTPFSAFASRSKRGRFRRRFWASCPTLRKVRL